MSAIRCGLCGIEVPGDGWELHVETLAHQEQLRAVPELGSGVLGGACCPACRGVNLSWMKSLGLWRCRECRQLMHPYSGLSMAEKVLEMLTGP